MTLLGINEDGYEMLDVTTLGDTCHKYIRGRKLHDDAMDFAAWKELSEVMRQVAHETDRVVQALLADPVCPNCLGTKHHKGFREWEECDGCGAEWKPIASRV
jgi:hypothetical protein